MTCIKCGQKTRPKYDFCDDCIVGTREPLTGRTLRVGLLDTWTVDPIDKSLVDVRGLMCPAVSNHGRSRPSHNERDARTDEQASRSRQGSWNLNSIEAWQASDLLSSGLFSVRKLGGTGGKNGRPRTRYSVIGLGRIEQRLLALLPKGIPTIRKGVRMPDDLAAALATLYDRRPSRGGVMPRYYDEDNPRYRFADLDKLPAYKYRLRSVPDIQLVARFLSVNRNTISRRLEAVAKTPIEIGTNLTVQELYEVYFEPMVIQTVERTLASHPPRNARSYTADSLHDAMVDRKLTLILGGVPTGTYPKAQAA